MHLFVYGTLKKGEVNHRVIQNLEYVGDFLTVNKYYYDKTNNLVYKTLSKENENNTDIEYIQIKGELYVLPKNALYFIDRFEKHPDYFYRDIAQFVMENDIIRKIGYMYFKV